MDRDQIGPPFERTAGVKSQFEPVIALNPAAMRIKIKPIKLVRISVGGEVPRNPSELIF